MPLTIGKKLTESWYTPKDFTDDPNPPRFKLKPLNGATRLKITSAYNRFTGGIGFEGIQVALAVGVVDWENVLSEQGKELKFSNARLMELDQGLLTELFNELFADSDLEDEEEKNSESQ